MNNVSKTWKFTDFNINRTFWENCDCNLIVFGEEACPKTGSIHLQGHVSFKRAYRMTALKKLRETAHWEAAKCSDYNYELKGENVFIKDNRKKKDGRSDLGHIADMVDSGKTIREIARAYPSQFIRYGQGILRYLAVTIEPRCSVPEVTVLWGLTGSGKSRTAREMCDGSYWVWTPARGNWFDGYHGQKYVIFEEFRGQLPLGDLLTILDRYECPVQYKGGTIEFVATNIIITSPCHPKDWYRKCEDENIWAQLDRRINKICNL